MLLRSFPPVFLVSFHLQLQVWLKPKLGLRLRLVTWPWTWSSVWLFVLQFSLDRAACCHRQLAECIVGRFMYVHCGRFMRLLVVKSRVLTLRLG